MSNHKNKSQHDKKYRELHQEELQHYFKEHYQQHKEQKNLYQQEYYLQNKSKILKQRRERHLQKSYGLSSEEYIKRVLDQDNKCAICNKEETNILKTGDVKPLSVDHNHKTGEVRKLLCNDCNALIGFAKEDISILERTIKYLEFFQRDLRNW